MYISLALVGAVLRFATILFLLLGPAYQKYQTDVNDPEMDKKTDDLIKLIILTHVASAFDMAIGNVFLGSTSFLDAFGVGAITTLLGPILYFSLYFIQGGNPKR